MAFFGLTGLGYQDPFQAARLKEVEQHGHSGKGETLHTKLPSLAPVSPYISHEKYKEIVRRHLDLRTPKQTQRLPLTAGQKYGWWVPQDPKTKVQSVHTWLDVPRYPMINSPMTR
ncbi:sperm microtubule inner protein 11 [Pelodytes ibericus]